MGTVERHEFAMLFVATNGQLTYPHDTRGVLDNVCNLLVRSSRFWYLNCVEDLIWARTVKTAGVAHFQIRVLKICVESNRIYLDTKE